MLRFRGHFATKFCRYSITLGQLRRTRPRKPGSPPAGSAAHPSTSPASKPTSSPTTSRPPWSSAAGPISAPVGPTTANAPSLPPPQPAPANTPNGRPGTEILSCLRRKDQFDEETADRSRSPARTYVRAPVGAQRPVGVPWCARGDYLLLALSGRRPAGVSGRPAHPIRSGPITCLADHSGRLRWPASRPVRRDRRDAVHDSVWNALPARLLGDPHLRWGGGWAGLPASTTSHDLRHHCASVLLLQGESVVPWPSGWGTTTPRSSGRPTGF